MLLQILTALVSIVVLTGIALRNTPECRNTIDAKDAIEIAFAQVPKFTRGPHKHVFESEYFLSKHIRTDKMESGWFVVPLSGVELEGYFVQFNFKNDNYEGTARFDITSCSKIKDMETGAWLVKPVNDQILR